MVGDPDQSIYGWRSAEVENLNKMTRGEQSPQSAKAFSCVDQVQFPDFPGAEAIHLEENYRSTGAVLAAAHSIVSQGKQQLSSCYVSLKLYRPRKDTQKTIHFTPKEYSCHSESFRHTLNGGELHCNGNQAIDSVFWGCT